MKKAPSDRYLWFRPESRNIWFRMAVPRELQDHVGKTSIACSLGTSDRREASILAGKKRAQLFEAWGSIARPMASEQPLDPAGVAVRIGFDSMLAAMEERRRTWPAGDDDYAAKLGAREADLRRMTRRLQDGDLSQWEAVADRAIAARKLPLEKNTDEYAAFLLGIAEASIDAVGVFIRRHAGELDAAPRSAIVQGTKAREGAKAKAGERLLELFEVYAAERVQLKKKRPAGVDQDRMVFTQFADFIGCDTAVTVIGYDQAKEFVDMLSAVPAGYKKRKDFEGLTLRQAVEKGKRTGMKTLSPITQERYISTLSPFFSWLMGERGGRRIRANPFDGLHLDTSKLKQANARPPFTADQITAIINSPLFVGFRAAGKEHLPGNERADDWRYWLPLICLFSGARIGEAAQLQVGDVFRSAGIWCAEFRSDEQAGQQTKNDKSRLVALHSTLLKMGFLAFVERQRRRAEGDGNLQLFPDLEPGPRHQYGDAPSKWWRRYLDKIGVKSREGRDGFGSHSFRHTLADQLRAAGHLDDVFGPLIHGHYKGGVTGRYGQSQQGTPALSSSLIESVQFVPIEKGRIVEGGEPVDFSHLITAEEARKAA